MEGSPRLDRSCERVESPGYNLTVRLTTNHSPSSLSFAFDIMGSPGEGEDSVKGRIIIFVLKKGETI